MSTRQDLRREEILNTAEHLLRKFGLAKTNVTDVARELGVSHGALYRYFPAKTALHEAVAERWLARISAPLRKVAEEASQPAATRLRRWFHLLAELKRKKVLDEPELFATYHALAEASPDMVTAHVRELHRQVEAMVREGKQRDDWRVARPAVTAKALLDATMRFHHPYQVLQDHQVRQDGGKARRQDLEAVLDLLMASFEGRPSDG